MQGNKKTQECPFYHDISASPNFTSDTSTNRARGKIIQLECNVKFYFFAPVFSHGKPSTKYMAIVSFGEHIHPPPPARKIPTKVKEKFAGVFRQFGLTDVTARRLLASPMLPILLDGKPTLSSEHIALTNMDAVNHLIRRERLREYPNGTDILGVQHLMTKQLGNPYIRQAIQLDDGHFVVLCQSVEQSKLFYSVSEIQADKTFRRTRCREFEINSFDSSTNRLVTTARVFTDYEDELGYHQAFRLVFETAENDVGQQLQWGHLIESRNNSYIKAIIVDEHGGQMKGLAKYFSDKYPQYTPDEHIAKIVKVCQTHYFRSITKLAKKGIPQGTNLPYSLYVNGSEICGILRDLPQHMTRESLASALAIVRAETVKPNPPKPLVNWLKHKDSNPWVLKCLCFPLSLMRQTDWIATSFTTNIGESAHALSQRHGKHLSLVGAIQAVEKLDTQQARLAQVVHISGVNAMYGNNNSTGRARKNLVRQRNRAEATKKSKKHETTEKVLMEAKRLLDSGISKEVIEEFLSSKSKS